MARGEAGERRAIVDRSAAPEQRQPRPGERVGMAGGGLEQQRHPRIGSDIAGVLGEIGQQQQRAGIDGRRRTATSET